MKNVHPCTFFIDEICDERKSRFYMEPAASVPLFACEVEQLRAVEQCTSVYTFFRHTSVYVGKRQDDMFLITGRYGTLI